MEQIELTGLEQERRDEQIVEMDRKFAALVDAIGDYQFWVDDTLATAHLNCALKSLEKAYLLFQESLGANPETGVFP